MHSTLQAELRFTQILSSSCRHCARRQTSKARSFHSTPRLRASQDPPSNTSSLNGRSLSDHAKDNESRAELAKERHKVDATSSSSSIHPETVKDAPSDIVEKVQPNFYGSATKRRLRNRMAKGLEFECPEWFVDNNIYLYGEGPLALGRASNIELVAAEKSSEELNFHPSPPSPGSPSRTPENSPENTFQSLRKKAEKNVLGMFGEKVTEGEQNESNNIEPVESEESSGRTTKPPAPENGKRYFVVADQYEEVVRTAKGLLRSPQDAHATIAADSLRNHLLLQYASFNGDLLLDHLVEDLAQNLGCDLVVLDAQDIAELVKTSDQAPDVAFASRMMSYEVFNDIYSIDLNRNSGRSPEEEEEEDEDDDDDLPDLDRLGSSAGPRTMTDMPVIFGRPITMALKLLGPGVLSSKSDSSLSGGRTKISDIFGSTTPRKTRTSEPDFTGVVNGIVKSLLRRRKAARSSEGDTDARNGEVEEKRESIALQSGVPTGSTILHIRDLRSIQNTDIGHQFLQELFIAISILRKTGTNVMLVGTDSALKESYPVTKQRINEIQDGRLMEISQNIVLTPVLPNKKSKLSLYQDKKRRLATINMRHLWQMMRYRSSTIFSQLEPGFWRRDFLEEMKFADRQELEDEIWTYAYVQRLATYIAGSPQVQDQSSEGSQPMKSAEVDVLHGTLISLPAVELRRSDETKARWAEKHAMGVDMSELPDLVKVGHKRSALSLRPSSFRDQRGTRMDDTTKSPLDDSRLRRIRFSATKHEKKLMSGIIESENIKTTFDDVHMPLETIDALQTLTTLSLRRPDAFKYGVLASDKIPGLLLYGPPGTGKTLAAKAVAKESGATMLEVSGADINEMYVGEGEKNVQALFSLAKKLSPCVVFLDEADAIFSARSNQGRRASHRELLNQFLKEWDGMSNDSGSAFIMVATNRPMDLDEAVLRRLPRRLLVDLPTESDRLEILKIHLRQETLAEDVDLASLAKKTPFYSGSDLKNVSVAAALNAVKEENEHAKQHTGEEPYQYPERRTLTAKHFEKAMEEISASISEDMSSLRDIKKFDEQYGDKRGKKKKTPKLGFPTKGKFGEERDTVKVRE